VRDKHDLVRLVRLAEGRVVVDERGTTPGRGAYVCRSEMCAERLVKGGRLSQAFRRPARAEPELVSALQAAARLMEGADRR
jgi:predicted RNA-binding protein YlxR (DUF448 family)